MKSNYFKLIFIFFFFNVISVLAASDLTLKVFIEGYYRDPSSQNNQAITPNFMTPSLFLTQYPGAVSTDVDFVIVELHSITAPNDAVVGGIAAPEKLQTNGMMTAHFPTVASGNYYIVVKSRNMLETWSKNPVFISTGSNNYDFTDLALRAYDDNMVFIENLWTIPSGDIADDVTDPAKQDDAIDAFDFIPLDPDIQGGQGGYLPTDLNGDGSVDATDFLILDFNLQLPGINGISRPNLNPSQPGTYLSAIYDCYIKNVTATSTKVTFEIWIEQKNNITPQHKLSFFQAGIDFIDYNSFRNGGTLTGSLTTAGMGVLNGILDPVSNQIRILPFVRPEASAPLIPYQSSGGALVGVFEINNSGSYSSALINDIGTTPQNYLAFNFKYGTKHTSRTGVAFFSELKDYTNPSAYHVGVQALVPTLTTWGLIALLFLFIGVGVMFIRRMI